MDIQILKSFFAKIASKYHVEMAFLYGSFASGYQRSDSDIDICVVFDENISDSSKIYSFITSITYELTKELNKEVNIITIDSSFSHPMLYYNAIVLGIPVFIRNYNKFINLKLEAVRQMEDFQIYGTRWQQTISSNILKGVLSHA